MFDLDRNLLYSMLKDPHTKLIFGTTPGGRYRISVNSVKKALGILDFTDTTEKPDETPNTIG